MSVLVQTPKEQQPQDTVDKHPGKQTRVNDCNMLYKILPHYFPEKICFQFAKIFELKYYFRNKTSKPIEITAVTF